MQYLFSFNNFQEIKTATSTWSLPDRPLHLSDDFYHLLTFIGSQVIRDKRYEEAADLYLLVALLFPYQADVWLQLGEIEQNLNHYQEAQMMYTQAILLNFNQFISHLHMAECLIELGDIDGALYASQIAESLMNKDEDKQKYVFLLERLNKKL